MSRSLETARETALAMPERWGLNSAVPRAIGTDQSVSAVRLKPVAGEVSSPASEANIIGYISAGEARHRQWQNGKLTYDAPLPSGSIGIIPSGVAPQAVIGAPVDVTQIYIPNSYLARVASDERTRDASAIELIDPGFTLDQTARFLFASLNEALAIRDGMTQLYLDSLLNAITVYVLRRWSNIGKSKPFRHGGLSGWQARQVVDQLHSQISQEPTLADLAASVGLSPFHFARAFKVSKGVPPHRYLIQLRIGRARELLESTDLPIIEIAAQVGYDDPSYFARLFRREVGVTPAAYRRERRR